MPKRSISISSSSRGSFRSVSRSRSPLSSSRSRSSRSRSYTPSYSRSSRSRSRSYYSRSPSPTRSRSPRFRRDSGPINSSQQSDKPANQLKVTNLTRSVTELHLKEIFSNYGSVEAVKLLNFGREKITNQVAIIHFETNSLSEAIDCMDGAQIDGRVVTVSRYTPRPVPARNFRQGSSSYRWRRSSFRARPLRFNRFRGPPPHRGRDPPRRSRSPYRRRYSRSPDAGRSRSPVRSNDQRNGTRYRSRSSSFSKSRHPPARRKSSVDSISRSPSPNRRRYSRSRSPSANYNRRRLRSASHSKSP